jgi:hypothetical protein
VNFLHLGNAAEFAERRQTRFGGREAAGLEVPSEAIDMGGDFVGEAAFVARW